MLPAFIAYLGPAAPRDFFSHFVSEPWIPGFFVLVGLAGIGTVVHTRVIRPWRSRSTPWIVFEVLEEQGPLRLRPEVEHTSRRNLSHDRVQS